MAFGVTDPSAIKIALEVRGADGVAAQFVKIGDVVHERVKAALLASADEIVAKAHAAAPVGGAKDKLAGTLRDNVDRSDVFESPRGMTITVRPYGNRPGQAKRTGNYAVALFSERGLPAKRLYVRGRVLGKARSIKILDGVVKRGRTFKVRGGGYYRNRPNIPARPWFSPVVDSARPAIVSRIDEAVSAATREAA